ncbi:tetratricopeptide repeat protein [Sinorhizobium medicae]|nr:tetratricopeptide repeat protein [Sinorhizobium medicae]
MMIQPQRYTSGRIALANLSTSIDGLERERAAGGSFESLLTLAKLLFLRGDLVGSIADHDRGEAITSEAMDMPDADCARALYVRAQIAGRFHCFAKAKVLLVHALVAGYSVQEIEGERAALLQATGHYDEALLVRERLAERNPRIDTLASLATLLAEMDQCGRAETCYAAALDADQGVSPIPCGQLLFEWGVSSMRRGDLDKAEAVFAALDAILPGHVPGRGHRAEVAFARGKLDVAEQLVAPLLEASDDPEYRALYAEILTARGDGRSARQAGLAAEEYERLLARRPEAYADHAAAFFIGIGNRPKRALELASLNLKIRDTPRSRKLLAKASAAEQATAAREYAV